MSINGVTARRHLFEKNEMVQFAEYREKEDISDEVSCISEVKSKMKLPADQTEMLNQSRSNVNQLQESSIDQSLIQIELSQSRQGIMSQDVSFRKTPSHRNLSVDTPKHISLAHQMSAMENSIAKHSLLNESYPKNYLSEINNEKKSLFVLLSPHSRKNQENNRQSVEQEKSLKEISNIKTIPSTVKNSYLFIFRKTNLVKKFISNIKNRTEKYIFKNLSKYQFSIINDKSSDYSYYQTHGLICKQVSTFYIYFFPKVALQIQKKKKKKAFLK